MNKKRWLSTSKTQNGDTQPPQQQPPTDLPLSKYYQSIHKLPLARFIDIVCDENIHALTITGSPLIPDLLAAWEEIHEQFTNEMGGGEAKLYNQLYKEFTLLKIKYDQVLMLINALDLFYTNSSTDQYKEMAADLNRLLLTNFKFDGVDEGFDKEIKSCKIRSGGLLIALKIKEASFNAMEKKQGEGKKQDRGFFIGVLLALSDHAKYSITENITVFEYCARIKNLNLFIEHKNKK